MKLAKYSVQREQAANKIRNILLLSTHQSSTSSTSSFSSHSSTSSAQSQICIQLLEQLQSIETQWVNTVNDLSSMNRQEPILIKQMLKNTAKEVKKLAASVDSKTEEELDLETVRKSYELNKVSV